MAPTRISLFGGSTDLPVFYEKYGGMVISMAVNIRQHIELHQESNDWIMPDGATSGFYLSFFKEFKIHLLHGMKAQFDGIIESGLGSSASAAVALIGAMNKLKDLGMSREEIAEKAWDIEVNKLGLYGGKQDQYAAAFGGMNQIWFTRDDVLVNSFPREIAEFWGKNILLFYTGQNRKKKKIQEQLIKLTPKQVSSLQMIKRQALLVQSDIMLCNTAKVGKHLDTSWHYKKESNKLVTNKEIDMIYSTAIAAGALGGKLCGSGGGGHMIFVVESRKQEAVTKRLEGLGCKYIDYSVDYNGLEVKCVL